MSAARRSAFHRVLLKLHLWVGLALGVPILVLAVTGCLLSFEGAVDGWLNPGLLKVTPQPAQLGFQELTDRLRAAYPTDNLIDVRVQNGPDHAASTYFRRGDEFIVVYIDQYTGAIKGERKTLSAPMIPVSRLHTGRVAGKTGQIVVGVLTMITLFAVVSGLYLWLPRKIFGVKWGAGWRRANFDLHNVFGLFSSLVLILVLVTGIMIAWEAPIEAFLVRWLDGKEVQRPPRVESTVVEGGRRLTMDEAVAIADRALPGTYTVGVNVLAPGKGAYNVMKRFPEDKTGAGRSRVLVDQYSGAVLRVVNSRELPRGTQIMNFTETIHTGVIAGWPTVALVFLATVALVGQVVTGFLIWWKPRRVIGRDELAVQDAAVA